MIYCALVILIAFILDTFIGDPPYSLHPVKLTGAFIGFIEKVLRLLHLSGIFGGGLLAIVILTFVSLFYIGLRYIFVKINLFVPVVLDIFIAYTCIALRDLLDHAEPIIKTLENSNIEEARIHLQKIVGRDTSVLDEYGIARAAIESISENFIDGFFSPLCWYVTGALAGFIIGVSPIILAITAMLIFKVVNTLDSMVGYHNEKYIRFGKISAKLDDIMNFIPARLAIPFLFLSSKICRLNDYKSWKIFLRDRLKHASPNSGHAESFVAGALGVKLGGPSEYSHGIINKPWIGDGSPNVACSHIISTCNLILCTGWISIIILTSILFIVNPHIW